MGRLQGFIVGALLALALGAEAQTIRIYKSAQTTRIDGLAINSARWTGWVEVSQERSVTFEIAFTHSSATAVTMRCESSDNGSASNDAGFDVKILYDSATQGTSDSVTHTWSEAVSGDESWTWTVESVKHNYLNCVFNGTGADGSDTVIVKSRKISP